MNGGGVWGERDSAHTDCLPQSSQESENEGEIPDQYRMVEHTATVPVLFTTNPKLTVLVACPLLSLPVPLQDHPFQTHLYCTPEGNT